MEDTRELKKRLRREYKARGAALTPQYREKADRAILEAVLRDERWQRARSVFLYVSIWTEPDTRTLIDAAFTAGKRVYVPFCCPDRTMKALRIRNVEELRPGTHGIPEPAEDAEAAALGEIDLAVVPCVTATRAGDRLGHGAGYYDRFLRLNGCPTICLCYRALLADRLPTETHDVQMDNVVSD